MPLDWKSGALAEGLACYRRQEFFVAHEHWESVWLTLEEPEKSFLQALIQITAAFHHLQRDNAEGTVSLLTRALARLETCPSRFGGIAVSPLCERLREWLRAPKNQIPSAIPEFAQIGLIESTNSREFGQ